jgi:hypothetical protein
MVLPDPKQKQDTRMTNKSKTLVSLGDLILPHPYFKRSILIVLADPGAPPSCHGIPSKKSLQK